MKKRFVFSMGFISLLASFLIFSCEKPTKGAPVLVGMQN